MVSCHRISPDLVDIESLVNKLKARHKRESRAKQVAWKLANLAQKAENRAAIAERGGLQLLVEILKTGQGSCGVPATQAIASFAQSPEYRKLIVHSGTIPCLVKLLGSAEANCLQSALPALANLAESSQAREPIVHHGGLGPTIDLLGSDSANVRFHAFRVLSAVSAEEELSGEAACEAGVAYALSQALNDEGEGSGPLALEYLANISRRSECQEMIIAAWGIPSLVNIVKSSYGIKKNGALMVLANLAEAEEPRCTIPAEGAVRSIVDALLDAISVAEATRCLANLSCRAKNCSAIVKRGGVPKLIEQLSDVSSSHVGHAIFAIANLSDIPRNRIIITEHGGVPPLVKLMCRGDRIHKLSVLRALTNLSCLPVNKNGIACEAALQQLACLLHSGCERTVDQSAGLLANLAEQRPNRRLIKEAGAIGPLVRLLSARNQENCLLNATRALANLSQDGRCQLSIVQVEGVWELIELCRRGPNLVKVQAARALYNMASNPYTQRSIVREGSIPILVNMLSSKCYDVREQALHTLIKLGMVPGHWSAIKHEGGFLPFTKQLIVSEVRDAHMLFRRVFGFCNGVLRGLLCGRWRW